MKLYHFALTVRAALTAAVRRLRSGRGSIPEFFPELVFGPQLDPGVVRLVQFLQHIFIRCQTLQVQGHERHVPLGRLPARERVEHQTGDHRGIDLDLDSLLLCAEQVPAPQDLLEEAEEDFDQPRRLHLK